MDYEPRPKNEDFQKTKENVKETVRNVTEQLDVAADQLVTRLKDLSHEGNIRLVRVKHDGKTLVEIPMTAAAVGGVLTAFLAPQLTILGALAGLIAHVTVEIERTDIRPDVVETKNDLDSDTPNSL